MQIPRAPLMYEAQKSGDMRYVEIRLGFLLFVILQVGGIKAWWLLDTNVRGKMTN